MNVVCSNLSGTPRTFQKIYCMGGLMLAVTKREMKKIGVVHEMSKEAVTESG